ncbi:MAG TPA: phenylalanine--tRNA ligase subunit beta, partial [Bacteroidales bacterium]|nr:phenylalanine--tRNA ligase subunit beta [Bacteroidales bacterium]
PRYAGVTLTGVKIGPSPEWLQNRIRSIGLHPINNVVDVTNFVLHETGQPLHAFDGDKIKGQQIVIKNLKEGTTFVTLDEEKRIHSGDDLIICNAEEGMALAGIFGGLDSGVTESTNKIFIESACFNPVNVRKTAKRQMLSTDASFRFERGTDPNMVIYALKRAAFLIKELAGGSISSDIVDVYARKIENYTVEFSFTNATRLIGKEIEKDLIKKILSSLDISILKEESDVLLLSVPPYRVDVQREADVVEEILRIYGYNNVEISDKLHSTLSYSVKPDRDKVADIISEYLTANGFSEIMNNSLTRAAYYDETNTYPPENVVKLLNPLSNELNGMRQTLLFGALETVIYNINRKNADLKLFEFGNCYQLVPEKASAGVTEKYFEENRLGIILTGNREKPNWASPEKQTSFFMLKSFVHRILNRLGIDAENAQEEEIENDLFAEGLVLSSNNKALVEFGAVAPKILNQFEIEQEVFFAEFHWDQVLNQLKNHEIKFEAIPRYPEVKRDLSLLLDENVRFGQLRDLAFKTEKVLLKEVSLFDVYKGKNIDPGKKSYALSFVLQDKTKTLKDKQIDKIMNSIMQAFEKELGAKVRQ